MKVMGNYILVKFNMHTSISRIDDRISPFGKSSPTVLKGVAVTVYRVTKPLVFGCCDHLTDKLEELEASISTTPICSGPAMNKR